MNVLIVDDNEDSRIILKKTLTSEGHTVEVAGNGKEALKMAKASPPGMIISDILMPVMDGFQLCREVKTDNALKDIPFVFYTATYTDQKDEELASQMGADKFIRKPLEPDKFIKIIHGLSRDVEKGELKSREPFSKKEEEVLRLYNERLVKKLEKKMLDLEGEIIKRKQAEEKIKASLREKEILLREIHHRVKNNLQIICSLLDMSSLRTTDQKAIDLFEEARAKVYAMALVHSQLYESVSLAKIDMGRHVREISAYLSQIYPMGKSISLEINAHEVDLPLSSALPCALVLNELISNAYKHAFVGRDKGKIEVLLERSAQDTVLMKVKDDGIGIPQGVDIYKADTLGLKLTRTLILDQLHGKIQVEGGEGTTVSAKFKILKNGKQEPAM